MLAILSDVHGNLEALRAVLADAERQKVKEVYCLGDVVGYGPDPRECLDLVLCRCRVVLMGNHDLAAFCDTTSSKFNPTAQRAILWTRGELAEAVPDREAADRRMDFLESRPPMHGEEGGILYVHGSPCNPTNEYVFPEDVHDEEKMVRLFDEVDRCCFQGHTHQPGVFLDRFEGLRHQFFAPDETGGRYRLATGKCLVNVGSVGQPRDGDSRACYVLFDGETVRWRRVEYDVEAVVQKMQAVPALAGSLCERLRLGR